MSTTSLRDTPPFNGENTRLIILISCVATIGGFLFGFDSGVINGTVDGLQTAFNSDSVGTGFNVASMLLGCAVGAYFAGRLADFFGRRAVLIVAAVFFIVSAWGSGIATGSLEFVIYRIIGGLAVGAASVMSPAYISEVSSARYRGRLATVQQIAIIGGLFAAFLSNYLLAKVAGSSLQPLWMGFEAWRWMFWIELFPAGLFLLALLFIPESPRYLVAKGRKEHAKQVLQRLYGVSEGERKLVDIDRSLAADHHRPRLSDLISKVTGRVRPIVWVGIGLAVFQQLVGINVVFYYGAVLWQAVGFSESDSLLINVISGALSIGACIVSMLLVDKVGRKPLLWVGSVGMAISLALVTVAFASGQLDASGKLVLSGSMGVLALVAANIYVIFFNASWGPVMWVMLGEMFPNQIRGSGLAVAGLFQWGANFLITWTFPMLLAGIGLAGAYGLYCLAAFISIFFVLKYVQETKGKELEQMEG
ncbi:sugar porter family MFS transporter [Pseudoxanthomonas dokdonensis]|uniref:D-xylose-proton symporter n=1 Tax=Pseudoxanthomonas dokdonensis TaxID=344882 RepID=A0A0R0CQ14_9GAMM|nr:sugar porter family MFS transporter [Pseudoxanthomonas dokdonensis]KRG71552.1 major facilitator transporter [Pseudoxanthomonas dokdonensis]